MSSKLLIQVFGKSFKSQWYFLVELQQNNEIDFAENHCFVSIL